MKGRPMTTNGSAQPRAATGRLTVKPGDTIVSTWGNTTYDQTMEVFDSAAQRDAQWATPHDGALAYTLDTQTSWMRRAGAWTGFASPPQPPVTTGTTVQSFTDAAGDVWVAKNGVNGGAWKKARDVLHASYHRSAAFTIPTGTAAILIFDTVENDDYTLLNTGNGIVTFPVAGLWSVDCTIAASPVAATTWIQNILTASAGVSVTGLGPSAGGTTWYTVPAFIKRRQPAGATVTPQMQTTPTALAGQPTGATHIAVSYLGSS